MGTPEFAKVVLDSIIKKDGLNVAAVYTQPDKPKGRGKKMTFPPVKERALEEDIPVYQPLKLRDEENVEQLKEINPDIIVVAAYGQILPVSILEIPKYGCINVHASLLPEYRGAAPVERAILDGKKVTGVTTMYMAKGLDTGDMLEKAETEILPTDTAETLLERLSVLGGELILSTIEKLENGTAKREKQDDEKSCYAKMLTKEEGRMDFSRSAEELERSVRGYYPWPCAYTDLAGKNMKILQVEVVENKDENAAPGTVIEVTKKYFVVACGEGALKIKKLQPEGKGAMDCAAFLNGNRMETGAVLGAN